MNTSQANQIRQQAMDVSSCALDLGILIQAIFDQLDTITIPGGEESGKTHDAISAINCFATCALRNVDLVKQGSAAILAAAKEAA